MKSVGKLYRIGLIILTLVPAAAAQDAAALASQPVPGVDPVVVSEFEKRVRVYTQQRESIEDSMPPLSKQATAAEITAHKAALLKKVLADRKGAKRGEIFSPAAETAIRQIIAAHYKGRDAA